MSQKQPRNKDYTQKVRVRLYINGAKEGTEFRLSKEQERHLKVLRAKIGEKVRVFDGIGNEFEALFQGKTLTTERSCEAQKELKTNVTFATAVPKGSRMDFLIEKVSELGISNIIPIKTARSAVEPRSSKIERLRKITIEACAQSGRAVLPAIQELTDFDELLKIEGFGAKYICHKDGTSLLKAYSPADNMLMIIGPEGDFTSEELEKAEAAGCKKVSLGPTILRIETAAIAALSQITGLNER